MDKVVSRASTKQAPLSTTLGYRNDLAVLVTFISVHIIEPSTSNLIERCTLPDVATIASLCSPTLEDKGTERSNSDTEVKRWLVDKYLQPALWNYVGNIMDKQI